MKKINLKELSKTQTIIITVIVTVLVVVLIPLGIFSGVNNESPFKAVNDIFTPDTKQIIGKWQDEKKITGYEFYDDGTYDYHVTDKITTSKDYRIDGNKITLLDYNSNANVVYKFSIHDKTLKLTLVEYNGKEPDKDEMVTTVYTRASHFNLKRYEEALSDIVEEAKQEHPGDENKEESTEADNND